LVYFIIADDFFDSNSRLDFLKKVNDLILLEESIVLLAECWACESWIFIVCFCGYPQNLK